MSANPNLEFRKRGNMSCAKKYKDCCAFPSICENGHRGLLIILLFRQSPTFDRAHCPRSHDQSNAMCQGLSLLCTTYLGVDRVHVSLGHVTDDDLVVGAVEQLVVFHHSMHRL